MHRPHKWSTEGALHHTLCTPPPPPHRPLWHQRLFADEIDDDFGDSSTGGGGGCKPQPTATHDSSPTRTMAMPTAIAHHSPSSRPRSGPQWGTTPHNTTRRFSPQATHSPRAQRPPPSTPRRHSDHPPLHHSQDPHRSPHHDLPHPTTPTTLTTHSGSNNRSHNPHRTHRRAGNHPRPQAKS